MQDSRPPTAREHALVVFALSALAVAQPLFDLLSSGSDFFVAHRSTPAELVAFAAVVFLGVPLLLLAPAWLLSRFSPRAGAAAHFLVELGLACLLLLPPLERSGVHRVVALSLVTILGAALASGVVRFPRLRSFFGILSPLTLFVPLVFLLASPVAKLVRPQPVAALDLEIGNPIPVIVIVLDELPLVSLLDDSLSIDERNFPNFAALAGMSYWFRNATSVAPSTSQAVPALVSGRYPHGKDSAIATEYPRTLFSMLAGRYDFQVVETQTLLCAPPLCRDRFSTTETGFGMLLADSALAYLHVVLPEELRQGLPPITATWKGFLGPARPAGPLDRVSESERLADLHIYTADRTRPFEEFLAGLDRGDRPELAFLHLMLPHLPWVYLPSGTEYWGSLHSSALAEGLGSDQIWAAEPWQLARAWQRHLLQVAYVDRLLGRLLERLEETGLLDEALLIVAADHGFSFQAGEPSRRATARNFADVMAVPFFVRLPGQDHPQRNDRNVEIIDVLPTIADVLEVELPFELDGRSVFDSGPERATKSFGDDEEERMSLDTWTLEVLEPSLERKLETFERGWFGIGGYPEIVGRPLTDLAMGSPAPVEVHLDQAELFCRVDLDTRFLPVHVFGRARSVELEGGLEGGHESELDRELEGELDVAIAVNGVVRAVTRAFGGEGKRRFAALVPEESLVPGDNSIEILVLDIASGEPILRPTLRHQAPTYSLERSATGEVVALVSSDGSRCALDGKAVDGAFYRYDTGFAGWAKDVEGGRPYAVLMIFADGRLIHTVTTGIRPPRPAPVKDVSGYEAAGFRFVLPAELLDNTQELRIFAILGDRGTELTERQTDDLCFRCLAAP